MRTNRSSGREVLAPAMRQVMRLDVGEAAQELVVPGKLGGRRTTASLARATAH